MSVTNWVGQALGGRYHIEALLGQGGMSAVYRAIDPNLHRTVAVKLIHPHLSTDPEFVRRFEQEAAAVAQLRHPNIIQVFDFNHDADVYYMVLEYVAGETLQNRLRTLHAAGQRLSAGEAALLMATICDAVTYAHQHGMVHRDLKPANVMLDAQGQPILMDFGVAKMLGSQGHTASGAIVGTVAYMSPEQIRGLKVDERADLYSLGVMLFEMAAGRPPFEGDTAMTVMYKHVSEPPPDIQQFNAAVPVELRDVILKALEKEPHLRYQTAAEMARDLRALRLLQTAVTPPAPATVVGVAPAAPTVVSAPAPAAPAAGQRPGWLIPAGLAAVVVVALAAFALWPRGAAPTAKATETAPAVTAALTEAAATSVPTAAPTEAPATAASVSATATSAPTSEPTAAPPTATSAPAAPAGMALIPAGVFTMGTDIQGSNESPAHKVSLDAFFLDVLEVTNAQYRACVQAKQCAKPAQLGSRTQADYFTDPAYDTYPVLQVTWADAQAYCASAGKRLPTEAEWEYAARGPEGLTYPWGNTFDPARVPAGSPDTVPVGSLDNASPFGIKDLVGNVKEWAADWYVRGYTILPDHNPAGPARGGRRVIRGGAFGKADGALYTATRRESQLSGYHDEFTGFRCAQSLP